MEIERAQHFHSLNEHLSEQLYVYKAIKNHPFECPIYSKLSPFRPTSEILLSLVGQS